MENSSKTKKPTTRPDYIDVWERRGFSYNKANTLFPHAREQERSLLIDGLQIRRGHTLLDVSAGGGYLPIKVHAIFGKNVKILAIEPSDIFAAALPTYIKRIPGSSATCFKLADNSVNRISNLSGLHHTDKVTLFFSEAYRTLWPGGIVGIAEVCEGSPVDEWLNVFVHRHNPHGHEGVFFKQGALSAMAATTGFRRVIERRVDYAWDFESPREMVSFCRILFGLDLASDDKIKAAIKKILGFTLGAGGRVKMRWELLHLFGTK